MPTYGLQCGDCSRLAVNSGNDGWIGSDGKYFCRACWIAWGRTHDPSRDLASYSLQKGVTQQQKRGADNSSRSADTFLLPRIATPQQAITSESIFYCDAHCHVDYILQNQKHGFMVWMRKTKPCTWWKSGDICPYAACCDYSHGPRDMKNRDPLQVEDVEAFALRHSVVQRIQVDSNNCRQRRHRRRYQLGFIITNCCELEAFEDTQLLVNAAAECLNGRVFCTFGCHPANYDEYTEDYEARVLQALKALPGKAIAVGECGLDYAKVWGSGNTEEREKMIAVFVRQIQLAARLGLPLVVHTREAEDDTLKALQENLPAEHRLHIHSYQGSQEFQDLVLRSMPNAVFGVSGLVLNSYENGNIACARTCPLDRLVLETDAPYLSDEPQDVVDIAEKVAELKGTNVETVLAVTSDVCARLYGLCLHDGTSSQPAAENVPSWHKAVDWDREDRIRRNVEAHKKTMQRCFA